MMRANRETEASPRRPVLDLKRSLMWQLAAVTLLCLLGGSISAIYRAYEDSVTTRMPRSMMRPRLPRYHRPSCCWLGNEYLSKAVPKVVTIVERVSLPREENRPFESRGRIDPCIAPTEETSDGVKQGREIEYAKRRLAITALFKGHQGLYDKESQDGALKEDVAEGAGGPTLDLWRPREGGFPARYDLMQRPEDAR
jgi:hypothetical protein